MDAATAHGGVVSGDGGRVAGQGGWQGKDADREERRPGIPGEPKQKNKRVQKTGEEKRNKMDRQEKNRKPVNQGKSYTCLHPGADL